MIRYLQAKGNPSTEIHKDLAAFMVRISETKEKMCCVEVCSIHGIQILIICIMLAISNLLLAYNFLSVSLKEGLEQPVQDQDCPVLNILHHHYNIQESCLVGIYMNIWQILLLDNFPLLVYLRTTAEALSKL